VDQQQWQLKIMVAALFVFIKKKKINFSILSGSIHHRKFSSHFWGF